MKCYHHNDLDGRCAAAIVNKNFQSKGPIEFIEMDYKKDVDVAAIQPNEKIVIVDFSFKPDVMKKIREKTSDIIWCDHHVTCKDYDYFNDNLPGLRDLTLKGLSGCELTWKYFFPEQALPEAVCLIGDYDSWRLKNPNCFKFYEAMKTLDQSPKSLEWGVLFDPTNTQEITALINMGTAVLSYRDNLCRDLTDMFGFDTEIDGVKAYATNFYRFGSGGFLERFKNYPVCIAFIYDGKKYTVSLYSESVDVSAIAKKYGGGGHKGASGFICEKLPFTLGV